MNDSLYLGALGSLAGVIALLWGINQKNNQEIKQRADKIEKKHDEASSKLLEMSEKVGNLEGRVLMAQEVKPMIERLHNDFLKAHPEIRQK